MELVRKKQDLWISAGEKIKENLGKKELEEVVAKLIEDLRGEQVRCNAEEGSEEKQLCEQLCDKFKPILATFGTNFDLKDHVFPEQYTVGLILSSFVHLAFCF